MKKLFAIGSLAVLSTIAFSQASIDVNLKYGAKGQEVVELQEFLADKGFLTSSASGNFFSLTRKAVIAYQTSLGLPATGYVGPMTRTEINKDLAASDAVSAQGEVSETGTTTPVVVAQKDGALAKQVADLNAKIEEQKNIQAQTNAYLAQVAQNTAQVVKPAVSVASVSTQVPYTQVEPTDWKSVPLTAVNTDSTRADLFLDYATAGDKAVFTMNGVATTYIVQASDIRGNKPPMAYYNISTNLQPNTEYPYQVRVERNAGDVVNFAVTQGTFKTLAQ